MRSARGTRGLALLRIDALTAAEATGRGFAAAEATLIAERPAWLAGAEQTES